MKRIMTLILAPILLMAFFVAATAEETHQTLSLSGSVISRQSVTIAAPFGGIVEDYDVRSGDAVEGGQTLFTLRTAKVYAPINGIARNLRAQPGDDAVFMEEQYGGLLYLDSSSQYLVQANTHNAYNKNENRMIHIGETVFLKSVNSERRTGQGFVSAVDGINYTVEVTGGSLVVAEGVRIYRSADYESASKIGEGKTARINPIPIHAEGSVFAVHVAEGAEVKRGDLLLEMVSGTVPSLSKVSDAVFAPTDGVIKTILAEAGTHVEKDTVLAVLLPRDSLQIAVPVNETDLYAIRQGDMVTVDFIAPDIAQSVTGTVAYVSSLSNTETGDAEYTAYIDFKPSASVKPGMSVTVSFEK